MNESQEQLIRRTIRLHFGQSAAKGILLPLKEGMTNDSFLFTADGKKYIFRCNGEGTECLIDRENEKAVYELLSDTGITERIVALSTQPGYKISRYYEHSHVCDPHNEQEVTSCMEALRSFHERRFSGVKVFDPFAELLFYETLMPEKKCRCSVYRTVREQVFSLRPFVASFLAEAEILCHIDAVSDNFLFVEGRERPYLIDWEYAGLSDPLIDIAMFAIYADYREEETEQLIAAYFPEGFDALLRARIHTYMAVGGLLWYDWSVYKSSLGVTFGPYEESQFRFAKEYAVKARKEWEML